MRPLPDFQTLKESDLCLWLVHTAAVAGYAIQADLIGARIQHRQSGALTCACQLPASGKLQPVSDLIDWPLRLDDAWLHRFTQEAEGVVSRLKTSSVNERPEFMAGFQPIQPYGGMTDAVCLRLALAQDADCSVIYLRCGEHAPFGGNNMWMLRHLAPVIHNDIKDVYSQWKRQMAWSSSDRLGPLASQAPDLTALLARLSKTERVVLEHLRTWETERDIARAMKRSPHTIHVHVKSIYRKLMVTSRKQLLAVLKPMHDQTNGPTSSEAYKSNRG